MSQPIRCATLVSVPFALLLSAIVTLAVQSAPLVAAPVAPAMPGSPGIAAGPALTPTLSVFAHFVASVYRDVLGRPPDTTELSTWRDFLNNGNPRLQMLQALLSSDEYFNRLVGNWYLTYLHRPVDPGGLNGWVSALKAGSTTDEQVIASLVGSAEYINLHGGMDNGWIDAVYSDLLNRPPTPPNKDGMLTCLTMSTHSQCAFTRLLSSPEYRTLLVTGLYQKYLRRPPTSAEVSDALTLLAGGATDEQFAASLAAGDEYFTRFAYFYFFLPLSIR